MKPVKGSWSRGILDPRAVPQPEAPRHRARKDTERWCRGRIGKRHLCAWRVLPARWGLPRLHPHYPTTLRLCCVNPGCAKVVVQGDRLDLDWPTQWGSRHDESGRRAFYGPGLPPDFGWGSVDVPDYVDVIGSP